MARMLHKTGDGADETTRIAGDGEEGEKETVKAIRIAKARANDDRK
jgi:hypothetical protein